MEYRYKSTETISYFNGLVATPGMVVDWDDQPPADGRWEPTEETAAELERRRQDADAEQPDEGEQQDPETSPAADGGGTTEQE